MATIQLGMFVSNIAGSIGGTTFKRFNGGIAVYNKINGGSKIGRKSVNNLLSIGVVFRAWSTISQTAQGSWNNYATTIQFPDKFGNLRYITGRQLFNKCNCQLLPVAAFNANASSVSSVVSPMYFSGAFADLQTDNFDVDMSGIENDNYFLIQVQLTSGTLPKVSFTRRKIIAFTRKSTDFSFNFASAIYANFPNISVGNNIRYIVTPMALNGIRGTSLFIDLPVISS